MFQLHGPSFRWGMTLLALAVITLLLIPALALAQPRVGSDLAQPTPAHGFQRGVVGGEGAKLRDAPGGSVVETLPLATALWVTGRTADNAWLQVALEDGPAGWVRRDELIVFGLELVPALDVQALEETASAAETDATAGPWRARVVTGGRNLNLRQGPAARYGIVGAARHGQTLTVLARDETGDWLLVALPGSEDVAWAAARYLDLDGDPGQLPLSGRLSQARIVQGAAGYTGAAAGGLTGTLVFQTSSGGPIMAYDLATGASRRLTTGMDPAISPDGKTVAFVRDGGGDSGLYLIDMDGGNERRILAQPGLRAPAWSPDGERIAFSRVVGQGRCRAVGHGVCLPDAPWLDQFPLKVFDLRGLSSVDRDGGAFRDLPSEKGANAPDWGDAGVLYHAANGIQLTADSPDAENRALIADIRASDPAWRPDGSAVVFVRLEKDHREIMRANGDGSGVVPLTRPGDFIENPRAIQHVAPVWSPDGRWILYLSDESGDWAFYVMDANGRNVRKLPIDIPIEYRFQGEQVVDWGE